jgi:hypothetical protein
MPETCTVVVEVKKVVVVMMIPCIVVAREVNFNEFLSTFFDICCRAWAISRHIRRGGGGGGERDETVHLETERTSE